MPSTKTLNHLCPTLPVAWRPLAIVLCGRREHVRQWARAVLQLRPASGRVPADHRARCRLGSARHRPYTTVHGQTVANAMRPIAIPAQVSAKDGVAQIPDTRLWYWDTGGQGVPIVLSASGDRQRADLELPAAGVRAGRIPCYRLFAAWLL